MELNWNKKYRLVNSHGDIKENNFNTESEALSWVTTNGEEGHEYYIVPFYTQS